MTSSKKKEIVEAVNKVAYPSKMLSLFCLEENFGSYFVSYIYLYISIAILTIVMSLTVFICVTKPAKPENLHLANEIDYFDMLLMISIPSFSIYNIVSTLDAFNESLGALQEVYDSLEAMGKETQFHRSPLWSCYIFVAGAFVIRMAKSYTSGRVSVESVVELGYYIFLLCQAVVLVHRYCGLVGISRRLFDSCCKEVHKSKISSLETLVQAHHDLCHHTLRLSNIQMPHIFLVLLVSFVFFVSESYKCLAICLIVGVVDPLIILVKLSWIGIGLNLIVLVVNVCADCSKKVSEISYESVSELVWDPLSVNWVSFIYDENNEPPLQEESKTIY